jgi:hypothetical protein
LQLRRAGQGRSWPASRVTPGSHFHQDRDRFIRLARDVGALARPDTLNINTIGFHTVDSTNERASVARYLEPKTIAFGAEIAREALGKRYDELRADDWRRITGHVLAAGWRKAKVDGHPCFVSPTPTEAGSSQVVKNPDAQGALAL